MMISWLFFLPYAIGEHEWVSTNNPWKRFANAGNE
jgi:hypothetical protein